MKFTCPKCKKGAGVTDPTEGTPGGVIQVLCPNCGKVSEVKNPAGDESVTLPDGAWLRPVYGKIDGARARDGSGPSKVVVIDHYEAALDGEAGAIYFNPGSSIPRRLAPKELLT